MIIGVTYDLRSEYLAMGYSEEETAEYDSLSTIEAIAEALHELNHTPELIGNIKNLVNRLAEGQKWDLVFNIAEGTGGFGREAQIPAVLEAYHIPYTFSDPLVLSLCLHKEITKRVLKSFSIPTSEFFLVRDTSEVSRELSFPLFAKPVAEGTGKGIDSNSIIKNQKELLSVCTRLLNKYNQPVLVESFLPGREFTVGIIGTGNESYPVGALEIILKENAEQYVYSYANKEYCEERVIYRLARDPEAEAAVDIALRAWKALGCRDAGRVDLRSDINGIPNVIEINPLAGLNPEHSDLPIVCKLSGIGYVELIGKIVESASTRNRRNYFTDLTFVQR
ncbi:MAG: D-alanine--D-alanine ligase [Spirochaetes bacterium]|nr:MAG: D-alanine--D-alanine ligase [Spirochaetota bacterium]